MKSVLILCTGNSIRSQMAEGLLRHLGGQAFEVASAGTNPSSVHPLAIKAMAELRIDISRQRSKSVTEFLGRPFDYVITVCDNAKDVCPVFPGHPEALHWSLPDPTHAQGSDAERLEAFRRVRNDLRVRFEQFVKTAQ